MNPAFVTGISRDQELTADRIRGFAVEAFSGLLAGCLDVKSLGIGRSRHISGPLHSIIEVRTDFIHSHDKDHFSRSLGDTGHAIGISVDIHHDTVACDGIGPGKANIRIVCSHKTFPR